MTLDKDKLVGLWTKLQFYKSVFWAPAHFELENFVTIITTPGWLFFEVYKFGYLQGIVYFTNVAHMQEIQMHGVLFERTLTDKAALLKELLLWLFTEYPIERVEVALVNKFRATMRFVERSGFKFEGIRRKGTIFRGKWVNQHMYSVTREDLCQL